MPVAVSRSSSSVLSGGLDPRLDLVHALVEAQAEERPNAVAVVCDGERITYADLNTRANQIAHRLQAQGVGAEVMVGRYMERSLRTIVAIVGILKAGGACVPIDLAYPEDRAAYIPDRNRGFPAVKRMDCAGSIRKSNHFPGRASAKGDY